VYDMSASSVDVVEGQNAVLRVADHGYKQQQRQAGSHLRENDVGAPRAHSISRGRPPPVASHRLHSRDCKAPGIREFKRMQVCHAHMQPSLCG
jgi:hypothetical protein